MTKPSRRLPVGDVEAGQRLDVFLAATLELSRAQIAPRAPKGITRRPSIGRGA